MSQDVDHVFKVIGGFNRFQAFLVLLLGINMFSASNHALISTFTSAEPPWRCCTNSTRCSLSGDIHLTDDDYNLRCQLEDDDWKFRRPYTSIVTDWNLVCDRSLLGSVATSMYFAGFLVGVLLFGLLSDTLGRRLTTIIGLTTVPIVGTISAYSPNLLFYCVCRFVIGIAGGGAGLSLFILATEFSDIEHRGSLGTTMWYFFTLSNLLLAPMAYYLRDWRSLILANSLPGFIVLVTIWWVPESPRWLLVQGRKEEAERILRRVARINRKEYPEETLSLSGAKRPSHTPLRDLRDMFRDRKIAGQTLVQWLLWFVSGMVYYSIAMTGDSIGGNLYLTFFLVTVIEIPDTFLAIKMMNRYGRKQTTVVSMIGAALAALVSVSFPRNLSTGATVGRILCSMVAKFSIVIAFDTLYVFSAELLPTSIRNTGMATCSASARIGSFVAPFLLWLQRVDITAPYAILGAASLLAGLSCLILPETSHNPTAEVMSSASKECGEYHELEGTDQAALSP